MSTTDAAGGEGLLIGRSAETGRIAHVLRDARNGRSGVLVLHGQAGIGKTALLDALAKAVRKGGIRLSGFGHQKETVITHFRDNIRDEKPDVPARWVKLKGDDHYFHAAGFMLFAYRLFQALRPLKTVEARSTVEIAGVDWMPNNFGLLLPGSYNQGLL